MRRLRVKAKKSWSDDEREMVKLATLWGMNKLDLNLSPVPIDIHLKGEQMEYGDAIDLEYKIVIRLFKSDAWIETLFHELEHARQYIYCELALESDYAYWRGDVMRRADVDYADEPWEIEARRVEEKLSTKFRKEILTLIT